LPVADVVIASIAGVSIKELVTVLFPHLPCVCVDRVTRCGTSVQIAAAAAGRGLL
jgi:hypothetical protein